MSHFLNRTYVAFVITCTLFVSFGTAYPTGLGPGYIIIGKMNPFRGSFIKGGDGIDSQKD